MQEYVHIFVNVIRGIFGLMLGMIGISFQADGSEGWAFIFYLMGLGVGIPGATSILIRLLFTGLYLGLILGYFWIVPKATGDFSFFDLFKPAGPDWWRYFWWVPVSLIAVFLALGYTVYKSFDEIDED